MSQIEGPNREEIYKRIENEQENISELQERWDNALGKLYKYFAIEENNEDPNEPLREIEAKTLHSIEIAKKPVILGFAGPGGAGKGTVREQIKEPLNIGDIINSTTREQRDYEKDGVHYNFMTTEDIEKNIILEKKSLEKVAVLLDLKKVPQKLSSKHLDEIKERVDKKFNKNEVEEGIDLDPDTENPENKFLNLTFRPLRGWYALAKADLEKGIQKNKISSFEESAPNLLKIGEGVDTHKAQFYITYVIPEQPIATSMAERALKRDGFDQPTEKLLSTIGGRQVSEFEEMVDMLISNQYSTKPILLLNDEGYQKGNDFVTRTGEALVKKAFD